MVLITEFSIMLLAYSVDESEIRILSIDAAPDSWRRNSFEIVSAFRIA